MKNVLKNRINIETSQGDRAFLLIEGDIFNEPADVYIFNAYKNDSGALMTQLKNEYGQTELSETPFFHTATDVKISKLHVANGKTILIIHTDIDDYTPIRVDQYKQYIEFIFASLMALETLGENVKTIALPVLFRNGLENIYTEAIRMLIEQAEIWLKSSSETETIKNVLFHKQDAEVWNEKLNFVLGRTVVANISSPELITYKNRALHLLRMLDSSLPFWEDTVLPLQNVLQTREFSPEVVAAFSRKLLEVYCFERIKERTGTLEGIEGLNEALNFIREKEIHDALDIQAFYQIRSFGNPSVHRPDPLIGPKTMTEKDITILLLNVCRLLELLIPFIEMHWKYSLFVKAKS